ncbi:MAG TPA: ABC transporter permease [Acidobacteriaceae bacterium]|jgi:predicted permease|nr:ABC transporter permease [Acidobacteriaceae bacterium]
MNLFSSIRSVIFRSRADRELQEELRSHISHRADDLERSGISRAEAQRRAAVEFGGYVHFQQESHQAMGGNFVETFLQDLRFGLRMLLKSPGFTLTAVLTLAIAIGANAVVFSVLNGLVLRPIDVPNSKGLVTIEHGKDASPQQSNPDYRDLRDRNQSFESMAMYTIAPVGVDTGGKASTAWVYEASGNYFDMLGVQPLLGRFFHPADEHGYNGSPYIVLTYAYWHSRFQSDSSVIGRVVQVNKHPYTVIGVAQPEFRGTELFFRPDFWVPIVDMEQIEGFNRLDARSGRGEYILARLKKGITHEQAIADLNAIGAYLSKTYPKDDGGSTFILARPGLMGDMLGRPVRGFLTALTLLATLILLAACANLGSLFASRASDRSKEIALRLALGSSRIRILRQLLTEAVMISVLGGTAGLAGAVVLLRWLSVWQPISSFPVNVAVNPDANVYLIALLLALVSGLLFGLVPIRQVLRANPYQTVKAGATGGAGRRVTFRDVLLVVQIVICAVLVNSSLVAVRGMMRSLQNNLGFQPQNAIVINTDLDMAGYSGDRVPIMQKRLVDAFEAIHGVDSVGMTDRTPLSLGWSTAEVFTDATTDIKAASAVAEPLTYNISPGYFSAAGTTLLAGRNITLHDDAHSPRVAVVNPEFARKVFGSTQNVIGSYFKIHGGIRVQVIGLVEDGKYKTITEDPQAAMFMPILQSPSSSTWLVVRSSHDAEQISAAVDRAIRGLDPGLPFDINTWHKSLDSALFTSRAATVSLGVLGALGAMLAVTGIFGMASFTVSRRMRELGIRIALGAQRSEVLTAALGRTLRLMIIGSVVGLGLGVAATKALSYIVYQASPRDPLVLAGVIVAMTLLALVATWIPASRALRADPLILLREE